MAKLFGFSIEDNEPLSPSAVSPVPPNNEDGSDHYASSGFLVLMLTLKVYLKLSLI